MIKFLKNYWNLEPYLKRERDSVILFSKKKQREKLGLIRSFLLEI